MSKLKKIIRLLAIKRLKYIANRRARKTKKRQFIVKDKGHARIISAAQFKWLKQHGCFPVTMTQADLKRISIYFTK